MSNDQKAVFVLGVGAQKSGTTWLNSYLKQNEHVNMGQLKEYHIWDAKFKPELFKRFEIKSPKNKGANGRLRYAMQNVDGAYEEYFRNLIDENVSITGDITPTYSALDAENYLIIKNRLEAAGFDVRVVFLMRDPVERCWSAARMKARKHRLRGKDISEQKMIKMFSGRFESDQMEARTQYDRIIETLEAVFEPKNLYVGVYEEMFAETQLRNLSKFLSVPVVEEFVSQKFNVSQKSTLPSDLAEKCRQHYSSVYEYCHAKYPQTRDLWSGSR